MQIPSDKTSKTILKNEEGKEIALCVLTREDSLKLWKVSRAEGEMLLLSDETILEDMGSVRIESVGRENGTIAVFPKRSGEITVNGRKYQAFEENEVFTYYKVSYGENRVDLRWEDISSGEKAGDSPLKRPVIGSPITSTKITNARARLSLTPESFAGCKQILVQVDYVGDIGYAFVDAELINDNFSNDALWEFGIKAYEKEVLNQDFYIYISPKRKGGHVNSDSEMAARFEVFEEAVAQIKDIKAIPIFDCMTDL